MPGKRLISRTHLLVLVALGATLLTLGLWKTPEGRLRAELEQAATDLSYRQGEPQAAQQARFEQALTTLLTADASIQIDASTQAPHPSNTRSANPSASGQPQHFSGVEGALQGLTQLRAAKPTLLLELAELTLTKQGQGLTGVGLLNLSETQVADLHREQRRLDLVFSRDGARWRLSRLRVGEADNDQPWERP